MNPKRRRMRMAKGKKGSGQKRGGKKAGTKKSGAIKARGRKGKAVRKRQPDIFTVPLGSLTLAHLVNERKGNENSKTPPPPGVPGRLSDADVTRIAKAVVALQGKQRR